MYRAYTLKSLSALDTDPVSERVHVQQVPWRPCEDVVLAGRGRPPAGLRALRRRLGLLILSASISGGNRRACVVPRLAARAAQQALLFDLLYNVLEASPFDFLLKHPASRAGTRL